MIMGMLSLLSNLGNKLCQLCPFPVLANIPEGFLSAGSLTEERNQREGAV